MTNEQERDKQDETQQVFAGDEKEPTVILSPEDVLAEEEAPDMAGGNAGDDGDFDIEEIPVIVADDEDTLIMQPAQESDACQDEAQVYPEVPAVTESMDQVPDGATQSLSEPQDFTEAGDTMVLDESEVEGGAGAPTDTLSSVDLLQQHPDFHEAGPALDDDVMDGHETLEDLTEELEELIDASDAGHVEQTSPHGSAPEPETQSISGVRPRRKSRGKVMLAGMAALVAVSAAGYFYWPELEPHVRFVRGYLEEYFGQDDGSSGSSGVAHAQTHSTVTDQNIQAADGSTVDGQPVEVGGVDLVGPVNHDAAQPAEPPAESMDEKDCRRALAAVINLSLGESMRQIDGITD